MLIYALVVLVLLLLILLFRYLPHRIFIVFVALAAVLCAIVVHMQLPERAPAPLTQEQRAAIARDIRSRSQSSTAAGRAIIRSSPMPRRGMYACR